MTFQDPFVPRCFLLIANASVHCGYFFFTRFTFRIHANFRVFVASNFINQLIIVVVITPKIFSFSAFIFKFVSVICVWVSYIKWLVSPECCPGCLTPFCFVFSFVKIVQSVIQETFLYFHFFLSFRLLFPCRGTAYIITQKESLNVFMFYL